jgi:hypothetical protein
LGIFEAIFPQSAFAALATAILVLQYQHFLKLTIFQFPSKIIYPVDYWRMPTNASLKVSEIFVQQLENFLGMKPTVTNLSSVWDVTGPAEKPIDVYLNTVSSSRMALPIPARLIMFQDVLSHPRHQPLSQL